MAKNSLHGSTSNPLKHLKNHHFNKLSDEDKQELTRNGETSGHHDRPKRTLYRLKHSTGPLPRNHALVKNIDRKVARLFVSSTVSWSLLENKDFGNLCSELLGGRYNIPSRDYILNNVMVPMYEETKIEIRKELKKHIMAFSYTDHWHNRLDSLCIIYCLVYIIISIFFRIIFIIIISIFFRIIFIIISIFIYDHDGSIRV